jgi:dTDP-4-amino-4,6-dideoxygalactose transaminase
MDGEQAPPLGLADPGGEYELLRDEIDAAVARVLRSGRYVLGPEVEAFEREAAAYLGVEHAVGVSSGTDAVTAALMALDVGPGDDVVTTALSFFATAGAVLRAGATPVFVDVEPGGFNLDAGEVERAVGPRTRAVVAVHLFGHPADLARLRRVCDGAGVPLVEDAAQAFGAGDAAGRAGAVGAAGCYSFFPAKPLGAAGDAGLVVTGDADTAAALRSVRVHGASGKNVHDRPGGNFRLDPVQAAILRVKLARFDGWAARRREHAELYLERLAPLAAAGLLELPQVRDGVTSTWAQFVIRTERRDALGRELARRRISTAVYYPLPMSRQRALGGARAPRGAFPRAERACREVLALPVHHMLEARDVERVVRSVREFFDGAQEAS